MNTPATMTFTITFHGPFHIGGTPESGLDRVLDRMVPLPGTSLKGLLRAEAAERLRVLDPLVSAIFGARGQHGSASPWWWSDAKIADEKITRSARIHINDATGTTERGFLLLGEDLWARTATFTVEPRMMGATADQALVIRAAARSVSALGGGRRRGSGWVTIEDDTEWSADDTRALLALTEREQS
jgi:CRISPR/Cas system CSM-associated protein Csm3 (group 7 of RAMP superfamily)